MTNKRTFKIWSDKDLDYEDWRADLEEGYPDLTDDERYWLMCETNDSYLDDERCNLNIRLSTPILVVASLGLWDGRRQGYKIIESGNIADCLYSDCDLSTWYLDENGDLCYEGIHHDGTNYYTYRAFRDDSTEEQREELLDKLYDGEATQADIEAVTRRLGDEIAAVYGWDIG